LGDADSYSLAWQLVSGPESGIYRTRDAGKTWKKLAGGLPAGPLGRSGLDIARTNPRVLHVFLDNNAPNPGATRRGRSLLPCATGSPRASTPRTSSRPGYFSTNWQEGDHSARHAGAAAERERRQALIARRANGVRPAAAAGAGPAPP
jgi:hypothetical protein